METKDVRQSPRINKLCPGWPPVPPKPSKLHKKPKMVDSWSNSGFQRVRYGGGSLRDVIDGMVSVKPRGWR